MTFKDIVNNLQILVNGSIIPVLFALAFIFFLINIVRYFFLSPSDEGREKGKKALLWGLIGLVLLFCVWGVVAFLLATLNSLSTATPAPTSQTTTTQTPTQATPGQTVTIPSTPANSTPGQPLTPSASTQ